MTFGSFQTDFFFILLYQYYAFRAKRREAGYSEDDLKENYGFLLFDDVNKVKYRDAGTSEKKNMLQ